MLYFSASPDGLSLLSPVTTVPLEKGSQPDKPGIAVANISLCGTSTPFVISLFEPLNKVDKTSPIAALGNYTPINVTAKLQHPFLFFTPLLLFSLWTREVCNFFDACNAKH